MHLYREELPRQSQVQSCQVRPALTNLSLAILATVIRAPMMSYLWEFSNIMDITF